MDLIKTPPGLRNKSKNIIMITWKLGTHGLKYPAIPDVPNTMGVADVLEGGENQAVLYPRVQLKMKERKKLFTNMQNGMEYREKKVLSTSSKVQFSPDSGSLVAFHNLLPVKSVRGPENSKIIEEHVHKISFSNKKTIVPKTNP